MILAKIHSGWRQLFTTTTAEQCAATWLPLREVVILVINADFSDFGTLRAANLDVQYWALVWQYVHTIESTSDSDSVALQLVGKSLSALPSGVRVHEACTRSTGQMF